MLLLLIKKIKDYKSKYLKMKLHVAETFFFICIKAAQHLCMCPHNTTPLHHNVDRVRHCVRHHSVARSSRQREACMWTQTLIWWIKTWRRRSTRLPPTQTWVLGIACFAPNSIHNPFATQLPNPAPCKDNNMLSSEDYKAACEITATDLHVYISHENNSISNPGRWETCVQQWVTTCNALLL